MFSIWSLSRLNRKLLLTVITGVFLMSCLLIIAGGKNGPQGAIIEMEQKYITSASLIGHPDHEAASSVVMPGVPLMIAGLTSLFGDEGHALTAYRLIQCVFHAFSVYLVFVLCRYMFNTPTALIGSVIYALYWPAYGVVRLILPDTTMQMLMLMLVCAVIGALEFKQAGWYIAAGLLTALVAYFNLQALLYPVLFIALWWRYQSPWKVILIGTALISAGYLLAMSPWWLSIPLFEKLMYLPGPWNIAPLWLDARFIEGNPIVHLFRSVFGGLSTKYAGRFDDVEARRVVQSALDFVRLFLLYAGVAGLIWSVWKYRLKRQLPVLLTLLYFIAADWLVPSLDGTGFPYGVFILMYTAFLANKAVIYAHKSSLHRSSSRHRKLH
ncbi:ArnT family glycosyltransferase [Paenibacillus dakarensis]|uniref:ArnT family glycosyltransferase n=1 Tax=Paenibacillus dakarensis TaxID=1527293 RepID=UPI0006D56F12|nr:glycosyltransferase family 39 protein [Paenibacillus dakarensis]